MKEKIKKGLQMSKLINRYSIASYFIGAISTLLLVMVVSYYLKPVKIYDDRMDSIEEYYLPKYKLLFNDKNTLRECISGEVRRQTKDYKILRIETYLNGMLNGPSYMYYENGNLFMEQDYLLGKRHGKYMIFNPNGMPAEIYYYSNDIENGVEASWDKDGSLKYYAIWKNGEEDTLLFGKTRADHGQKALDKIREEFSKPFCITPELSSTK